MHKAVLSFFLAALATSAPAQTARSENDLQAALQSAVARNNSRQVLIALTDLESFYTWHNFGEKDAEILKQIVAFWSSNIQPDSVGVARYSAQLGVLLTRAGDYSAAEQLMRSAISIFELNGPIYEFAAIQAKRSLVVTLIRENKTGEADALSASLPPKPPREQSDTSPQILSKVVAQYSDEARNHNVSGSLELRVLIDEAGHPQDIQVTEPLGFGLDENAMKAVDKWKFKAATLNGSPVSSHATIIVTFRRM